MAQRLEKSSVKTNILNAALMVIRAKGYAATTVDDLCAASNVTKGAFFHHFKSKIDLAVAAAEHWSKVTGELFESAPYHSHADPLERVLGYLDFRKELLTGGVAEFTCLVGTMVQETFGSTPAIRAACEASISGHAAKIETDIAEAMRQGGLRADWTAKSLALHTQAVLQGAFILAKAKDDSKFAAASIDHLRRYIEYLFNPASQPERKTIMKITVETNVAAPIEQVWDAYTTPADIKQWNAASADWHTTTAAVDLREGGKFSSRMEAKDGSMGFDFAGTYTKVIKNKLIEYTFGDRAARVEFTQGPRGVLVRVTFDSEQTHSIEQQRQGWQSILDNFSRHVETKSRPTSPSQAATVQPYLFFRGRCAEAIEYYKAKLNAEVLIQMRFKDNPDKPGPDKVSPAFDERIMHACLRIAGAELSMSDGMRSGPTEFDCVALSLKLPTEAEADRVFNALAQDGKVTMPIGKTFFARRFGGVTDKFGVQWMVVVQPMTG